jgi:predicted enzyme related to lactoylglutathione lyase
MKVKEIGFVAIPVTDVGRARKFYEDVIGLKPSAEFLEGRWVEYGIGMGTLAIANVNMDWKPSNQGTSAALEMEDFDAAIEELRRAKVAFAADPFESPVCRMAVVQDPDGNKLIIHKLKKPNELTI